MLRCFSDQPEPVEHRRNRVTTPNRDDSLIQQPSYSRAKKTQLELLAELVENDKRKTEALEKLVNHLCS